MNLIHIIIYAVVQGLAELLPVSSSAHVIAATKLLHEDPTTPQFTLLLVLLHTGTMFAVIVYFWKAWKRTFFCSQTEFVRFSTKIVIATAITGVIGYGLKKVVEKGLSKPYTQLAGWHLSEKNSGGLITPVPDSSLLHIVATDDPDHPLFHTGDLLIFNGIKAGGDVATRTYTVAPTSKVKDLTHFIEKGYDLAIVKPDPGIPMPGVTLRKDAKKPSSAQIIVVGNENAPLVYNSKSFTNASHRSMMGFEDESKGEIEQLFKRLDFLAIALGAAGVLILAAAIYSASNERIPRKGISTMDSIAMGAIQGVCVPFRGFSRSGATISLGLMRGIARTRAEEFSFALAVVLTPVAVGYEALRLFLHLKDSTPLGFHVSDLLPGLEGMVFSFFAGLIALKLLSKLLEKGQWWLFGVYCLAASVGAYWLNSHGASF